jgi:hypothetical protein
MIPPPDYILAMPRENDVPEIRASCDKENIDELKEMRSSSTYIYKLVWRQHP